MKWASRQRKGNRMFTKGGREKALIAEREEERTLFRRRERTEVW